MISSLIAILPFEIWEHIISFCDFWDKMRFRQTCKSGQRLKIFELPQCFYSNCTSNHKEALNSKVINRLTDLKALTLYGSWSSESEGDIQMMQESLARLTNLTSLEIVGKTIFLPNINLQYLKLENIYIKDVYGLNQQTHLTYLIIRRVVNIKEFDFQFLKNLKKLKITQCQSINFNSLSLLTNLGSLAFFDVGESILEINNLTNLVNLKLISYNINFKEINGLINLTSLLTNEKINNENISTLTKLKKLSLKSPLISDLNHLLRLEELIIYSQDANLKDDGISALVNLTKLYIHQSKIRKIGHLTNLRALELLWMFVENDELRELTKLESFHLGHGTNIKYITHLTNLTHLECLEDFEDDQIQVLTKLQSLDCTQGPKNISRLTNLTSLHVYSGLEKDCLTALTNIKKIIFHCNNFKCLAYLPNITFLDTNYYTIRNDEDRWLLTRLTNLQVFKNCLDSYTNTYILRKQRKHVTFFEG